MNLPRMIIRLFISTPEAAAEGHHAHDHNTRAPVTRESESRQHTLYLRYALDYRQYSIMHSARYDNSQLGRQTDLQRGLSLSSFISKFQNNEILSIRAVILIRLFKLVPHSCLCTPRIIRYPRYTITANSLYNPAYTSFFPNIGSVCQ